VTDEEVVFIREFIARNRGDSRWMLSRKLCQTWGWVQPNGALRDMVCRGLMLHLARAGQIELPPIRVRIINPLVHRKKPSRVEIDQTPMEGKLSDIVPLEFREKNLSLIACNTRFLILPWVRVSCLASHILGRMARILQKDWERIYNHPLHYLETFIDQERFHGTCYRAANWFTIGQTTGRGKNDQTGKANRSLKDVLGYPLSNDFRDHLCGGQA